MSNKIERRFFCELRAESQGDEMSLVGYASKFGVPSHDLGGFKETVLPGAFTRSLREGNDVKCLFNHDPNSILGRTKNGTLKLSEDATGLRFNCVLPNTQQARDLHTLVKRGDIDGCSFAFIPREQSWENDQRDENGDLFASRKLHDVDLRDVSVVTDPAYPNTEVLARALFPEGEPVEVRSAVDEIKRKASNSIANLVNVKDSNNKEEHKSQSIGHQQAAVYHRCMCGDHDYEARDLMEQGDMRGAAKHAMASAGHQQATYQHMDAAEAHHFAHRMAENGQVGVDDAKRISARSNSHSKMALECSSLADKSSDAAPDFRSDAKITEKRAANIKRAAEQAIELNPISLPQPFDSDLKAAWWQSFVKHYGEALQTQKLRNQDALSYAIAAANKDNVPETEVTPEVTGQGKNPSAVPGTVMDTDGKSNGDDDQAKKKTAENEDQNRAKKTCQCRCTACQDKRCMDCRSDEECGDCDDPNCDCQNNDANEDDVFEYEDTRSGNKVRTKKVAGKSLTKDKFAFVGDPNDTTTWKLPVHDKGHADNAASRFNQTKGIPDDKKGAVQAKITAAQKKFGTKAAEEKSFDSALATALAKSRLIQLEVELQ